jgi:hypothetical protein
MPFGDTWADLYSQVYVPAIEAAALKPERADEVFRAGSILRDIVASVSRAAVVLADISENNRNVHYELGLAHAFGKPTLLVAPKELPSFFDVSHERMLTYDKNNAFWGEKLRSELLKALKDTMNQPESAIPTAFMHIKPSRIEVDEVVLYLRRIEEHLVDLSRRSATGQFAPKSGLVEKIKSLVSAEQEAANLLRTMDASAATRQLMNQGYAPAMAETAVARAADQQSERRSRE